MSFLFVPAIAFLLVVLLIMPLKKAARLGGIIDKPGGRKKHTQDVPPIGGLIIFSVFIFMCIYLDVVNIQKYWPLFTGLIVLMIVGAIDDQFQISPKIKLLFHVVVACLIAFWGNVQAAYLGDMFGFGVIWTGFMSYPFTIIATVLLINAMNLMDGLDGLVGGTCCVIFTWFMVASLSAGWLGYSFVLSILIACIVGFLVFNMRNPWRRRASLFLGDAGSMALGLTIAWFAVLLARGPTTPLEPIVVAWIIGFPIFDTCAQFYRRVCEGKHPFSADRGHFHHHFIDAGIPVRFAAPIIISLIAAMGGIGYLGALVGVPLFILTMGWIAMLFAHMALSRRPKRYVRLIKKCFSAFIQPSRGELDLGVGLSTRVDKGKASQNLH